MSDLSWLNPTPHAIAVYASRPLSPVAAQHSLPSGRYSLLGPGFHRLDRTSLRLAHSLDHLVGKLLEMQRHVEAQNLGGLEVDHQLERARLHDRQVGRLGAVENLAGVNADLTIRGGNAGSVADQAASQGEFAPWRHDGKRIAGRQRDDLIAPAGEKDIAIGEERPCLLASNGREHRLEVAFSGR